MLACLFFFYSGKIVASIIIDEMYLIINIILIFSFFLILELTRYCYLKQEMPLYFIMIYVFLVAYRVRNSVFVRVIFTAVYAKIILTLL